MTKLPTPEQWTLSKMTEQETAEMIEKYIDYVDKDGRSVQLPSKFVKAYMKRDDGVLPIVVAVATAPIVLADGKLLMPEGLDRLRGIIFEIQQEVRDIMPRRKDCDAQAIRAAMKFLCDVWLCDVKTDLKGQCIIISMALTIIERSLLPERPAFFVTAGKRGGGKTTTLIMLLKAVTGLWPAATAWSGNEEERRKSIMSQFLAGVHYILWDNIIKGTMISCPHIERSCTAQYYRDRKLGVSESIATAAATIHLFTGNNIGPKGDLASRSLSLRLDVDRPDPENREFKHPDPIGWTDQNRAEILRAFYIILLGNPQLNEAPDAPGKTRFKMWWRLVGSALEYASKLYDKKSSIDFKTMFVKQEEEEDEDSISLAEALDTMLTQWPEPKDKANKEVQFYANDLAELINNAYSATATALKEFFYPASAPLFFASPRSVSKQLNKHIGDPVERLHGGRWEDEGPRVGATQGQDERPCLGYFVEILDQ